LQFRAREGGGLEAVVALPLHRPPASGEAAHSVRTGQAQA